MCENVFLNHTLRELINISPQKMGIFEDDFPNFPFGGICIHSLEGNGKWWCPFHMLTRPPDWLEGLNHLGVLEPEMSFEAWL